MKPSIRLGLCATTILVSAMYGLLVIKAPSIASALMLGYVALLLTIIVVCHAGRKK